MWAKRAHLSIETKKGEDIGDGFGPGPEPMPWDNDRQLSYSCSQPVKNINLQASGKRNQLKIRQSNS